MPLFDQLEEEVAKLNAPLRVFFRNDDGGWANDELDVLCHWFHQRQLPLDVAMIPAAIDDVTVDIVNKWLGTDNATLHIHQHGFTHDNHQLEGRSCEFGSDRNYQQQLDDITEGQRQLHDYFGAAVEPIFTPPWNRCTSDTMRALQQTDFELISRIAGSALVGNDSPDGSVVRSLDVSIDWLKKRKGERLSGQALCTYVADQFHNREGTIGVMLHHEHMNEQNLKLLDELVVLLKRSERVEFLPMLETAGLETAG